MRILSRSPYIQLLREEIGPRIWTYVALSMISGAFGGVVVSVINLLPREQGQSGGTGRYLLLFVLAVAAALTLRRHVLLAVGREVEAMVRRMRSRVADRIRRCELVDLERLEPSRVFVVVSENTDVLATAALPVFNAAAAAILALYCVIQVAFISRVALLCVLLAYAVAIGYYLVREAEVYAAFRTAWVEQKGFFAVLRHLLLGIKEAKLNRARAAAIIDDDLATRAESVRRARYDSMVKLSWLFSFIYLFFFGMIGLLVFLLPMLGAWEQDSMEDLTATLLFLGSAVADAVACVAVLVEANVAVGDLREMEAGLAKGTPVPTPTEPPVAFESLELREAVFRYRDPRGGEAFYTVGPISLTIRAGETVFLVGGNGSGKSTLLKMLATLYPLESGEMLLNGEPIQGANRGAIRALCASVFTDFHLFDGLEGIEDVEPKRVDALLAAMALDGKVTVEKGHFSTTELSTGQRKRLALAVAMLEDRQLYLLDEVAADQDPNFRTRFYNETLAELKAAGKTTIVVAHHDEFFDRADRLYRLDYGRITDARLPEDAKPTANGSDPGTAPGADGAGHGDEAADADAPANDGEEG